MFAFDIETLGAESTSVILSYAIVYFDPDTKPTYQQLLDKTLFVKLDAKDQIKNYKRTICKDTLEWWSKQHEYIQGISLTPKPDDVSAVGAFRMLSEYIRRVPNAENQTFWQRGSLDQVVLDSLCRALYEEPIVRYSNWRDVRTAIDILYGSTNGYVEIDHPEFNKDLVLKHHPSHDICLDVMQLLYGKEKHV
jgi:hypothetical protein